MAAFPFVHYRLFQRGVFPRRHISPLFYNWRGARVSLQMERPSDPHCRYYPDAPASRTRQVFLCDDKS